MTTIQPITPIIDRRVHHAVALSVDWRYVVDDQLAGTPHAGNLYRQIPAHVTEQTVFAKPGQTQTGAKDGTR